jgi:hypothetical protein
MKPHSFVAGLQVAVGAPWEIRRLATDPNSRTVDMYTKQGDLPGYSSLLVLVPDWDLGFMLMTAGTQDSLTFDASIIANIVADTFLPFVESAVREEADAAFSGSYAASDSSLNSSVTITTDPAKLGLSIESWISNNTDMLTSSIIGGPSICLYPTGLKRVLENGDIQLGFRSVTENLSTPKFPGVFTTQCQVWANVDSEYWGTVSSDEWMITVDSNGKAKTVRPRALRVELGRSAGNGTWGTSAKKIRTYSNSVQKGSWSQ